MRVLYILNSADIIGGDSKSFLALLDGIRGKGVEPHVVVPGTGEMSAILSKLRVPVYVVNYKMNIYPNLATLRDWVMFVPRLVARRIIEHKAVVAIARICHDNNIDIVHTNVSVVTCGLKASMRLKIPHVLHVREFIDLDFNFHPYPSLAAHYRLIRESKTYAISITKGIQRHHNLIGERYRQIYNGITDDMDTNIKASGKICLQPYFFFAGRIEPTKGVMPLLKAFKAFLDKNNYAKVNLLIAGGIGDELYMKELQKYTMQNHLDDRVSFLGMRRDVSALMRNALATIVSSEFEAFGRCLPEAMLADCLTIGHNTGGTCEQYDNGLALIGAEIGLRYDTVSQLTECMHEVYTSEFSKFDVMRHNAKDVVLRLYNKETYVNEVFNLYNDCSLNKAD